VGITYAVTQAGAAEVIDARHAGLRHLAIGSALEELSDAAGRLIVCHLIQAGEYAEVALWIGHDVRRDTPRWGPAHAWAGERP
jgi:hypothetical protein